MAELADALDLGSSGAIHAGSTPVTRTTKSRRVCGVFFWIRVFLVMRLVNIQ